MQGSGLEEEMKKTILTGDRPKANFTSVTM